jgi:hypothetical protein
MKREMLSPQAGARIPSFTIYHVLPDLPAHRQVDHYTTLSDVMPVAYLKLHLLYRSIYHLTEIREVSHWIFGAGLSRQKNQSKFPSARTSQLMIQF